MNSRLFHALAGAATLLGLVLPAAASTDDPTRLLREQARAYEHGSGVKRNIDTALALYCQAALAGDVPSLYHMGWIYTNGRGVVRNDAFAAYYFKRAAAQGHEVSANMLALVGREPAKPPCIEQSEAKRLAEAQAAADLAAALAAQAEQAAAAEAAAKVAQQEAENRYKKWIDTAQEKQIMSIVRMLRA